MSATAPAAPAAVAPTATAAQPRVVRRRRSRLGVVVPPLVVFVLLMGLWMLVSYVVLSPSRRFLLPPPRDVLTKAILDKRAIVPMLKSLLLTARTAMIGLTLAVVVGSLLAALMAQSKLIERALYPYTVILQTVPILSLVPLIGFTLGFDFKSRVLVCTMISIFPIITNVLFGLLSVDHSLRDVFALKRAPRWTRFLKLQLPSALPSFFAGLRIAAGGSVVGAVVGDVFFLQGPPGLGTRINSYSVNLQSERLFAAVFLAISLGIAVFLLVGLITHYALRRWHESQMPDREGG